MLRLTALKKNIKKTSVFLLRNTVNHIETTLGFFIYHYRLDYFIRYIQRKLGWSPILMYHSINNQEASFFHRGLYKHGMVTEPEDFKKQIKYLSSHYTVVPLMSYLQKLRENNSIENNIAVLTFDDGFRDFLENALPVLERYKCSSTVFLVGNCILNNSPIWLHRLYELEEVCKEQGKNPMESILEDIPELSSFHHLTVKKIYRYLIYANEESRKKALATFKRLVTNDEERDIFFRYLSKSDIALLSKRGVLFGAHTMNHLKPSILTDSMLFDEVDSSIHLVGLISGQKDVPFAYPFGGKDSWDDRIPPLLQKANVICGCTTREGLNSKQINRFKLNRIDVSCARNFYSFVFKIVGLRAAMERLLEKPYYLIYKLLGRSMQRMKSEK